MRAPTRIAVCTTFTLLAAALVASCDGTRAHGSSATGQHGVPVVGTASTGAPIPEGPQEVTQNAGQWPAPNHDLVNSRTVPSSITSNNVTALKQAWTAPIVGRSDWGSFASTPLVVGSTVYAQDLASTVTAYNLSTGQQLWRHVFPNEPDVGPNGVSIGYGKLYGATSDSAFALNAKTGRLVWSKRLVTSRAAGIDMAPSVFDHLVYVSTIPGNTHSFYAGGVAGTLYALDTETGKVRWQFRTAPSTLWNATKSTAALNSGGGLWYQPAFSPDGSMFIDVANPAPFLGTPEFPWGSSRPGPNLYTNSLVKLDHSTGKLEWYRQVVPHDLYDWDLQLPPVLARAAGKNIVVVGGKMGFVYAFAEGSGKLLWKRSVGIHNGHDDDDLSALAGKTMPSLPETVYPGDFGGILTPLAVSGGTVYVPVVDLATTYTSQTDEKSGSAEHGEMVALDLATGKVKWVTHLPDASYGAATVTNDLVFTTTYDGHVYALDRDSGSIVWSTRLPAGTNSPVVLSGNTLITAAGVQTGSTSPELIAFRLAPSS